VFDLRDRDISIANKSSRSPTLYSLVQMGRTLTPRSRVLCIVTTATIPRYTTWPGRLRLPIIIHTSHIEVGTVVLETTTSGIGSAVIRIPLPILVREVLPYYINLPEECVIPECYKVSGNTHSTDKF
jgi:hypothetical protein